MNIYNISSLVISDSNIFVGTEGDGVFISTDNGSTWLNKGPSFIYSLAASDSCLFAGTSIGIFTSSDDGLNWNAANTGLTNLSVWDLAVYNNKIYAGTDSGGVYVSSNNSSSWVPLGAAALNYRVRSIIVSDTDIFVGTEGGGVFLSTDNGTNWNPINTGLTDLNIYDLAVSGKNIFAGTRFDGIFLSTDNGTGWTSENAGLANSPVYALIVIDGDLFAGTGGFTGNIWRRSLSEMITSVRQASSQTPKIYDLQQNYPNPFNPSTTISFALPSKSFVTMKIFDIMGRQVATIISEEMSAGNYSRQWNAANISTGVYFYRLHAGSFTETKKLILLK
ncbi:MAG: T9SS type A sorting domain-containing protein [Candidatus Kryptoniota bacterium]